MLRVRCPAARGPAPAQAATKKRTVASELTRLAAAGAIPALERAQRVSAYKAVKRTVKRLPRRSTRRNELAGVVANVEGIAARRSLTGPRLVPLWLTLERNRAYWSTNACGPSTRRISFPGSQLVWQWFPGQGLQFHPLANFAKLNQLWASRNDDMGQLLDELLALRVPRAGGIAWEYYFAFAGGKPPWVSGLAQGTGIQSIARVAQRTGREAEVLPIADQALGVFETATPAGVRVHDRQRPPLRALLLRPRPARDQRLRAGARRPLRPRQDRQRRARPHALRRRRARRARRAADLRHRRLVAVLARLGRARVRPLLPPAAARVPASMCNRTDDPVYCDTELRFAQYELEPPQLSLVTTRLRGGTEGKLRLRLSKISRVGLRVKRAAEARLDPPRRSSLGHGTPFLRWPVPRKAGDYDVELTAVDLAGNVEHRGGYARGLEAEEAQARPLRPRTILYTGKGGVGKTSVAAATARRCAAAGQRTIVLSTDPAHSLADSLEMHVGSEPTQVADNLWAQQVQAQDELERNWSAVQRWLGGLFVDQGVDRIAAEELTVPPGGDELFSLLQLKRHVEDGGWDVVIVDCAPTGETLRLLSFPDVAQWWLDKVFGRERALLAAARPIARTFFDVTLPDEKVFGEVQRLVENLIAMNEILRDRDAVSIRLVMTPDRMVIAEAMRTFTYLSLYGYLTDAVVVNRVFPEEVEGGYFGAWREVQREQLELVESGFAPVPVLRAPYFEQEVLGATMLDRLGASLFEAPTPARCCTTRSRRSSRSTRTGRGCGSTSRSPTRATSRSRRSASS